MHPATLTRKNMDELLTIAHDALAEMQRRHRPKPENVHLLGAIRNALNSLEPIERTYQALQLLEAQPRGQRQLYTEAS